MRFADLFGARFSKLFVGAGVFAGMLAASVPASADTVFSVQFFHVTESNTGTSDFHPGNTGTGTESLNYVQNSLVGGMPVFNSSETAAAGFTLPVAPGDNLGSGALGWWTPGSYDGGQNVVTSDGTMPLSVSSTVGSPTNMFPPDSTGNNNNNSEETAILSGMFNGGGPVTFSIAADDDAFIFVDGSYVGGLGGIHAIGSTFTSFTQSFGAGPHTIDIFYADQDQVAASLAFSSSVPITQPTPEPGSLALLGTGVLGLAGALRRRIKR